MSAKTHETGRAFQSAFFRRNPGTRAFFELFEYLPATYFYAKDRTHRYVGVNQPVLGEVFGLENIEDLLGRTDLEFQPPALAEAYHAEDRRVMDSGKSISNQVWLVPHVTGIPKWYVSSKTPMTDAKGHIIGIAGVMYPVGTPKEREAYFRELAPVIRYIEKHFTERISMRRMADSIGLSSTRFNVRFRQILHMSPSEFQLKLRVQAAQGMLTTSDRTMSEIAMETGFCDQSHFGKRFQKATGMSPRAYQAKFR